MTTENPLKNINPLYNDLEIVKELVYDKCGFCITNLKLNSESAEYGACSFVLNGMLIEYRVSKITPTKTGQFVTIWKRNQNGITVPFDLMDDIDFVVINNH
ncbi:MAG: MepB family protein [Salinivirgaceae bacterium]